MQKHETYKVQITDLTADEFQQFVDACSPLWESYNDGKYLDLINQAVAMG